MLSDPSSTADRRARSDARLARVVYIGTAMIPAYGPLRAARFMHARGVPPYVLVAVLRLGDRRRNERRALLPTYAPHDAPGAPRDTSRQRERETI